MEASRRLDAHLVASGAARSRADARELVATGAVSVDGRPARKASDPVTDTARVVVDAPPGRWVGRAAGKLAHALALWGPGARPNSEPAPRDREEIGPRAEHAGEGGSRSDADGPAAGGVDPRGRRCLDVGASTGGFTQVLLDAGAAHVVALDVGHDQLAPRIARDPRVEEISGRNVRDVVPGELGPPFDVLVGDLSFISLRLVLPVLAGLVTDTAQIVLLVKPQFEVGRARLGKNGIVRDADARRDAVRAVVEAAAGVGWSVRGLARSPVAGTSGNREYLGWFSPSAEGALDEGELERAIARIDDEEDG